MEARLSMNTPEIVADRPGLQVRLLVDSDELGLVEVRSSPGGAAPPAHVHRRHSELFYVLAGELTFTLGGEEQRAAKGELIRIPPGMVHTFAVTGFGEARYLNLHAPSCGFGNFLRALHAARDERELEAARAGFDQEPAP
jgi:quercetin dioxygenase-like cupin family protein